MADSLGVLATAFTWVIERFTDMAEQLLSTPLFLISVAFACAFLVINLVKSIL